ncbi:MAG: hypothetical protein AAGA46_00145 [Cyanobacteria bacterium P01_F01_bin.13]
MKKTDLFNQATNRTCNLAGLDYSFRLDGGIGHYPHTNVWLLFEIKGFSGNPVKVRLKIDTGELFYYHHTYRKEGVELSEKLLSLFGSACLIASTLSAEEIIKLAEFHNINIRLNYQSLMEAT